VLLAVAGCGDDDERPLQLSVRAEVVEADAPVEVEATAAGPGREEGWFEHEVRVTWRGEGAAGLDDARFVHRVEGEDGDLITLGRGCGWSYDEPSEELVFPCTADLQLIAVEPGQTHEYRISLPSELESFRLRVGTYVVEEAVRWWQPPDVGANHTAEGEFTVRLTYDVE
jgi:hypothetical protein